MGDNDINIKISFTSNESKDNFSKQEQPKYNSSTTFSQQSNESENPGTSHCTMTNTMPTTTTTLTNAHPSSAVTEDSKIFNISKKVFFSTIGEDEFLSNDSLTVIEFRMHYASTFFVLFSRNMQFITSWAWTKKIVTNCRCLSFKCNLVCILGFAVT